MDLNLIYFNNFDSLKGHLNTALSLKRSLSSIFSYDAIFTESVFASKSLYHDLLGKNSSVSCLDFLTYHKGFHHLFQPFFSQEELYSLTYLFLMKMLESHNPFVKEELDICKENLLFDVPRVLTLIKDYETYLPLLVQSFKGSTTIENVDLKTEGSLNKQKSFYIEYYNFLKAYKKETTTKDFFGYCTIPSSLTLNTKYSLYRQFHFILPQWTSLQDINMVSQLTFLHNKEVFIYVSCQEDSLKDERMVYNQWLYENLSQYGDVHTKQLQSIENTVPTIKVYHGSPLSLKKEGLFGFSSLEEELDAQYHTLYQTMREEKPYVHDTAILTPINPEYTTMIKYQFSRNDDNIKTHFLQYEALENQSRLFFTKFAQLLYNPNDTRSLIGFLRHPWVCLKMKLEPKDLTNLIEDLESGIGAFFNLPSYPHQLKEKSQQHFLSSLIDFYFTAKKGIYSHLSVETLLALEYIDFIINNEDQVNLKDVVDFFITDRDIEPRLSYDVYNKIELIEQLQNQYIRVDLKNQALILQLLYEENPLEKEGYQSPLIKKVSVGSALDLLGAGVKYLLITQFSAQNTFFPYHQQKPIYNLRTEYDKESLLREAQIKWVRFADLIHHAGTVFLSYTQYNDNQEPVFPHPMFEKIVKNQPLKVISLSERELLKKNDQKQFVSLKKASSPYLALDHKKSSAKAVISGKDLGSFLKEPLYMGLFQENNVKPKLKQKLYKKQNSFSLWFLGDPGTLKKLFRYALFLYFKLKREGEYGGRDDLSEKIIQRVKDMIAQDTGDSWKKIYSDNPYNVKQVQYYSDRFALTIHDYFENKEEQGYTNYHSIKFLGHLDRTIPYEQNHELIIHQNGKEEQLLSNEIGYVSLKEEKEYLVLELLIESSITSTAVEEKYSFLLTPFIKALLSGRELLKQHHKKVLVLTMVMIDLKEPRVLNTPYRSTIFKEHEITEYLTLLLNHFKTLNLAIIPLKASDIVKYLLKSYGESEEHKKKQLEQIKELKEYASGYDVKVERTYQFSVDLEMLQIIEERYLFPLRPEIEKMEMKALKEVPNDA